MVRIAILKGDKSIDDLATRLFDLRANATRMRSEASDALKRANPGLSDLAKLPPGSVVIVPDQPGATKAGETFTPTNLANMNVPQAVTDQVATFKGGLDAVAKGAADQANATLALLKDKTVAAAAANDPDLLKQLSVIADSAKTALKDAEVQSKTLQDGIVQLEQDLAGFLKLISANFQPPAPPSPTPAPEPSPSPPPPIPSPRPSPLPVRPTRQPAPEAKPAAAPPPRRSRVPARHSSSPPAMTTPSPDDSAGPSGTTPKPKTARKKK